LRAPEPLGLAAPLAPPRHPDDQRVQIAKRRLATLATLATLAKCQALQQVQAFAPVFAAQCT